MAYDEYKITKSMTSALEDLGMESETIAEAVFHMTDWLNELAELHTFCENPESLSDDQLQDLLMNFLVHVPNHVAAASKLIADIPVKDIFELGANVEDKE